MSIMWFLPVRRQESDITEPTPPGIPYELFMGFLWAGAGVASISITTRLYARFRTSCRLYLDDFFILFAYILLLTTAGLWQWGAKDMYYILNANAGLVTIGPDFDEKERRFLLVSFIVEVFFYTILIMFKLSMLFFFKRLGDQIDRFRYYWWSVLVFAVSIYFVSIGNMDYNCLFGSLEKITLTCNSASGTYFLEVTLDVNCALDVLSDFLIMLLPIILLWNVRIRWRRKLALFGLFSLSLIIMAIAIARAADIGATKKSNGLPDSTYIWFWSSLQSFLCIVVSCASAFRQLFVASARSSRASEWTPTDSYYERFMSSFRSRRKRSGDLDPYDVADACRTGEASDYIVMGHGSEAGSRHSSQSPIYEPSLEKPETACYKTRDQSYNTSEYHKGG